jgi:enoyl-CoA hydratase/carnithine racemase
MSVVIVEREDRVLHITLNRADKRNALNGEMCSILVDAITRAQGDESVGAVLLDARGRVFCAGMDLDEAVSPEGIERASIHEELFSLGRKSKKPLIACVCGPAMGGGVGLIAQAHVAIAAQGSLFGLTEIRIGMWPFVVYRSIEAAVGERRALELSLTGRLFSTQEALTWGLIHQVAHAFEAEDRAATVARDISKMSPAAVALGMEYVHGSRSRAWTQAGELAATLRAKSMVSADFKEGVAAFHQKREAQWPSMPPGTYTSDAEPNSTDSGSESHSREEESE